VIKNIFKFNSEFDNSFGKGRNIQVYETKVEIFLCFSLDYEYLLPDNLPFWRFLHIEHMLDGEYLYQQECTVLHQLEDV
jgi:hypothetical protein